MAPKTTFKWGKSEGTGQERRKELQDTMMDVINATEELKNAKELKITFKGSAHPDTRKDGQKGLVNSVGVEVDGKHKSTAIIGKEIVTWTHNALSSVNLGKLKTKSKNK